MAGALDTANPTRPGAVLTEAPGVLAITGRLDITGTAQLWASAMRIARSSQGQTLVIDLSGLTAVDTAGAALVAATMTRHGDAALRGAGADVAAMVAQAAAAPAPKAVRPPPWTYLGVMRATMHHMADALAFLGEGLVALVTVRRRRRQFRLADLMRLADEAGWRALPLVLLLGYLMGLILAFQSSIPLRRFGADLFVVNLVGLSLLRELGPLLAAVVLAGRTGSAFAAELGTMKVNEELAALETMGLSPVTMLVLPRLAAAVLVMPVLTLFLELAGLCGMLTVMLGFGYSPAAVSTQLLRAVHGHDLWSGLFKALVFGVAVAGIGCRAGLATGFGPRAVGQAATAAVVGGIVMTIVLDGVFAVVFFRLGV
ncbi:ABC transporter permease [Acidisphaera sp. L21]|uniref:ABC transporter permease n=1 Tax=Acidisphaera sp. L21 TaxID=1641851 RepID=UPI00131B66F6|nr:ABC transporter permease [Acidisphaera sp. L21]